MIGGSRQTPLPKIDSKKSWIRMKILLLPIWQSNALDAFGVMPGFAGLPQKKKVRRPK